MEISSNYDMLQGLTEEQKAQQAEALYHVKLIKMQQESAQVVGDLLQDTVEISNEAMQRFLAERNQ